METCYGVTLVPETFQKNFKLYEHIKTHLKAALVQIRSHADSPSLGFLCGLANAGIMEIVIESALKVAPKSFSVKETENLFSFRNVSPGGAFMFTRHFFAPGLKDASICFYKRPEQENAEYVKSQMTYCDNETHTRHTSVTEQVDLKFRDHLQGSSVITRMTLSPKTTSGLQKWLRGNKQKSTKGKEKESQPITISIYEALNVVVFSNGEHSYTTTLEPACGMDYEVYGKGKVMDMGVLGSDSTTVVDLETLCLALGICKVPGMYIPGIRLYDTGLIDVEAVPIKPQLSGTSLRVVLLQPQITDCAQEQNKSEVGGDNLDLNEEISEAVNSIDIKPPPTPSPTIKSVKPKKPAGKKRPSCEESALAAKKPKSVFNPLI